MSEQAEAPPRPSSDPDVGRSGESIRLLRRAGKGEVVVAVPRSWVRSNGLQLGGSLRLRDAGPGRLILEDVRVRDTTWGAQVTGRSEEPLEHLFRCLVAAYLAGTTDLVLDFPQGMSQAVQRTVREFARRSGRMEVVAEGNTTMVLRDISNAAPADPVQVIVRMARAALELQKRAGEGLSRAPRVEEDSYWEGQDDEVDRLEWRVHRTLAAQFLRAPAETVVPGGASVALPLLAISRALERIADHAVRIGRASASLPRTGIPPSRFRPVAEFHAQVTDLLERSIPLLERPDASAANEIADIAGSLHEGHIALLQSLLSRRTSSQVPPLTAAWIAQVLDSVDRSAAYVADIAELSLDRAAIGWVHSRYDGLHDVVRPSVHGASVRPGPHPQGPVGPIPGNNMIPKKGGMNV